MRSWVFIYRFRGRRSGVQGYPQLLSKFKANMGCLKCSPKENKQNPKLTTKEQLKGVSDSGKDELTSAGMLLKMRKTWYPRMKGSNIKLSVLKITHSICWDKNSVENILFVLLLVI